MHPSLGTFHLYLRGSATLNQSRRNGKQTRALFVVYYVTCLLSDALRGVCAARYHHLIMTSQHADMPLIEHFTAIRLVIEVAGWWVQVVLTRAVCVVSILAGRGRVVMQCAVVRGRLQIGGREAAMAVSVWRSVAGQLSELQTTLAGWV